MERLKTISLIPPQNNYIQKCDLDHEAGQKDEFYSIKIFLNDISGSPLLVQITNC